MTILFELVAVGVLILLNAFFVAAEYGLVTARRTRIVELQHQGDRRARDVLRITSDPPRFIAAMQLGVTLTSLGIGALGEVALSRLFDRAISTVLAVIFAYLILTFLHVVIGELVPKGVALGHAEGTALWVSVPVRAFFNIFGPRHHHVFRLLVGEVEDLVEHLLLPLLDLAVLGRLRNEHA